MKNGLKIILSVVALVAVLGLATLGYRVLSDRYLQEEGITLTANTTGDPSADAGEPGASETNTPADAQNGSTAAGEATAATAEDTSNKKEDLTINPEMEAKRLLTGETDETGTAGSMPEGGSKLSDKYTADSDQSAATTQEGSDPATQTSADTTGSTAQEERFAAPDFSFQDASGNMVNLSDYRGKPVILNFWATWCGPCRMEMPYLQAAYDTYGSDVNFLIVNLTDGGRDTVESATAFATDNGYTFPLGFDVDYDGAYTYGVSAIPQTYFIDGEGYLLGYHEGTLPSQEALFEAIDTMLGR
ncbi:MAG: TlpA family protein disulfide reductase [Lachnospiraceae bacterium]|nr:TlpA family protein disulfide reductase [Lachnospiraceae bacterium]